MNIKNQHDVEFWSCKPATPGDCRAWVCANARGLVWAKFRYWQNRLRLPGNLKTIEAGCGYGKFSMVLGLSGAQVTLLDNNATALASALDAHRSIGLMSTGMQGDILSLPPGLEGRFDMACSFGTLEHFSGHYRRSAFQANARLLRPGGLLFFVVPNRWGIFYRIAFGLLRRLGRISPTFYEEPFSRSELRRLAAVSGIHILDLDAVGTLDDDFRYWIGRNAKGLCRKLFRIKKDSRPLAQDIDLRNIDLSGNSPDSRNCLDRHFSAGYLFVGQKTEASMNPGSLASRRDAETIRI